MATRGKPAKTALDEVIDILTEIESQEPEIIDSFLAVLEGDASQAQVADVVMIGLPNPEEDGAADPEPEPEPARRRGARAAEPEPEAEPEPARGRRGRREPEPEAEPEPARGARRTRR